MADETQKSPAELRAERFERLRSDWSHLAESATLGDLYDRIETLRNSIDDLSDRIGTLRERGYVYGNRWETQAEALKEAWPSRARKARSHLRDQANRMEPLIEDIERFCDRTHLADGQLDRLEEKIERAEDWIGDADSQVRTIFTTLDEDLASLNREFHHAEYMLDALDEVTFPLLPEEDGVAACEAVWTDDKEEPKGVLFVTNHRLIFERREKVAKKKVLFITTKSELVKEKLWETPIGGVISADTEDKGALMFSKELLHLNFAHDVRTIPEEITLRLKGRDNDDLRAWIELAKTGEIAAQRYDAGEEETASPAAEALPDDVPTVCPACGAQLPTVYQGMQELVCEYCGSKVRL
jgi:predicted  nucleic acid-binding Zn-ribbon protein